jgi:hypothetical protein
VQDTSTPRPGDHSSRSALRIADLKRRPVSSSRLMNVKIPARLGEAIDGLALKFGTSKTEIVVALLNTGLDAAATKLKWLRLPKGRGPR